MENSTDEEIPCAAMNYYYYGKEHCFRNAALISVPIHFDSKVLGNCCAVAADIADYFVVFGIAGYCQVVDCCEELRIVGCYEVVGN